MSHTLRQLIKLTIATSKLKCTPSVSCRYGHRWVVPTLKVLKKRQENQDFFYKGPPRPPAHRNTYLEWNYPAELYSFGKRLKEDLDSDILQQALTHRSYVLQEIDRQKEVGIDEPDVIILDNTQMIEEGEKIMADFILPYLRVALPKVPEEGICAIYDYLLKEETLAEISNALGTTELILSRDYPVENATLAETLKAVISCVLKSSGLARAQLFIRDFILPRLAGKDINSIWSIDNPHKVLKTILINDGKPDPEPRLIGDAGKNTLFATFRVGLYIDKEFLSVGCGETVGTAHEMAALDALRRMFGITERDRPFPLDLNIEKLSTSSRNPSLKDWSSKLFETQTTKRIASST